MKNQTNGTTQSQMPTIPAGSLTASFEIPIATSDQTITVAIDTSNLPDGVAVGATGATATVTIKDDDTFLRIRSKVFLEGPL